MTFSYALVGGKKHDVVVLAADSQITYHHCRKGEIIGTYENRRSKIRRIGNGRWALSVAGNSGLVETLLQKVDARQIDQALPFENLVQTYQAVFIEEWKKQTVAGTKMTEEVVFMFCGFTNGARKDPLIVRLDSGNTFGWSPTTEWAWSGAVGHGAAIYLHNRFIEGKGLSAEQTKLAVYCVASEVAEQDNSVGGVIEVEVITPEGSLPLTDIPKYEAARKKLVEQTERFLLEWEP